MATKRSSIRIRPENVRVGLLGIEIEKKKREALIKGLGINDDAMASRVIDDIKTALRHHADMVRLDKLNDSPAERKKKLSIIAGNAEIFSKALPIDYETYCKIMSYMKSTYPKIDRLTYAKEITAFIKLLKEISLAATQALQEIEDSDNMEPSHFRCTLISMLESVWIKATKTEMKRNNKNTHGRDIFTPVQFIQEVISIIEPSFNEVQADSLIQYYKDAVASGKKFD